MTTSLTEEDLRVLNMPIDAVESMNRLATDKAAEHISALERTLLAPISDLDLLVKYARGKRLLDIGCGSVRYADEFTDRGFEYTGIDISAKILEVAKKRWPSLHFRRMSFRDLRFPDGSFDAVFSCCALQYEPKRNIAVPLGEIVRVLSPGGCSVIVMPYSGWEDEFICDPKALGGGSYSSLWAFDEFRRAIVSAGGKILHQIAEPQIGSMTFVFGR